MSAAPRRLRRPQAILFDWDNTLVDSWATIHEALNAVMTAMGKPLWSLAETRERVRLSLRESFPVYFGEKWEEARQIYLAAFRAIHLERLRALPGREQMLHALKGEGIWLGVVSNKTGAVLRRETQAIGWASLFGSVVGAGDAALDKPDAAPVVLALEPSGVAPGDRVWLVGDTAIDMQCAAASGCLPVLLGSAPQEAEFLNSPPALAFSEGALLFRFLQGL
ncbi:MAG TPA: HAD hydrolase-like protein [Stellaceae bacterium]|nr:HAD hydrolase-like protein [Stellaceae bacterium]